jgi:hypothetical protein
MTVVSYYTLLRNVNMHETIGLFLNHFQDTKDDVPRIYEGHHASYI